MTKVTPTGDNLHNQIDRAAHATDNALHKGVESTQSVAHDAVDRGTAATAKLHDRYDRAHDRLSARASQQPLSTVAVAAGIGALIGVLVTHQAHRHCR